MKNLANSVDTLNKLLQNGSRVYGVTSGFGGSANTIISDPKSSIKSLINLLNVGFNTSLSKDIVRGLICLRINNILRNHSAVRRIVVEKMV